MASADLPDRDVGGCLCVHIAQIKASQTTGDYHSPHLTLKSSSAFLDKRLIYKR